MSEHRFIRSNLRWLNAGILLNFLSCFGQTFFIAIFAQNIQSHFQISHGIWGGIYALGTMLSALIMIWSGALCDRFRIRTIGIIVLTILALACLMMAQARSLWALPLIILALRLAGQGMSSHLATVAMGRWFVASRGKALAISKLGFSLGEAALPFIFVALMQHYDWQILWVLSAGLVCVAIPVFISLLAKERNPQAFAQRSQSAGMRGRHWSRKDALNHPLFWCMMPAIMGVSAFGTAFFFHQVHFAHSKDWSLLSFVALIPLYTSVSVASMLVFGWALDRWGTGRLLPGFMLPMALGFAVFAQSNSLWGAALGFILFGLTAGGNATLATAFWAEYYGTRHIGAIKALATAVMVLGSAAGPGLTGYAIDAGWRFSEQFYAICFYFCCATLLLFAGLRACAPARPR